MTEAWAAAQGCMGPWVVALFIAGALYASFTMGVTGGPNHGEHPFTLTVIHLGIFLWAARRWAWGPWLAYGGLLLLALVAAVLAMGLVGEQRGWVRWGARGGMLALHAGMLAVALRTG